MANATRKGGMGGETVVGHQHVGTTDPRIPDEDDLAPDIKGRPNDQGDHGDRLRNQRTVMPGSQDLRNQPEAVATRLESGEAPTERHRR